MGEVPRSVPQRAAAATVSGAGAQGGHRQEPVREQDPLGSWVPNTGGPGGGLPGGRFDMKRLEEDLEDASMQVRRAGFRGF